MKILVTGCAGFIGYHLTKRLVSEGHEVVGVDNLNSYYDPALKVARLVQLGIDKEIIEEGVPYASSEGFSFIKAGIESANLYQDHLNTQHFDVVCHLAAQAGVRYSIENPQQYISSNIQGFFNILEYCRHRPTTRLVFASSSSVYGKNTSIPYKETDVTDTPVSLYAATKKTNELMAHSYSQLYDIQAVGLRFFTVYGPWGRPDMAPFLFTKAILGNEPIKVFNHGKMSRDFTYIDDIVEGVCRILLNGPDTYDHANFRIYNIGNSSPVNLNDFIHTIEQISGLSAHKVYLPMQPGDVEATWADTSLLQRHYGYSPATPLHKGLSAFVSWYEDYYIRKLYDNPSAKNNE